MKVKSKPLTNREHFKLHFRLMLQAIRDGKAADAEYHAQMAGLR